MSHYYNITYLLAFPCFYYICRIFLNDSALKLIIKDVALNKRKKAESLVSFASVVILPVFLNPFPALMTRFPLSS